MRMRDFMPPATYELYKEKVEDKKREFLRQIKRAEEKIEKEETQFYIPRDEMREIWSAPIERWDEDRIYVEDKLKRYKQRQELEQIKRNQQHAREQRALADALAADAIPAIKKMARKRVERQLKR